MTAAAIRDRLQRRVLPRAIVALSTVDAHHRAAAAARRWSGGSGTVRLYVAFDDPLSAVALLGLSDRLAARRVRLLVEPVVARGIPGDPAAEAKRRYAVLDAARLARRDGRELAHDAEPLAAADCAFLAAWAAGIPQGRARAAFCAAAAEHLWFGSAGPPDRATFAVLYERHAGGPPPADGTPAAAERSFRRRRLYDTPVAVVAGRWFFAHERQDAIEHRLDALGWTVPA